MWLQSFESRARSRRSSAWKSWSSNVTRCRTDQVQRESQRDAKRCEELEFSLGWRPELTGRLKELETLTQDSAHQWHVGLLWNRRQFQVHTRQGFQTAGAHRGPSAEYLFSFSLVEDVRYACESCTLDSPTHKSSDKHGSGAVTTNIR